MTLELIWNKATADFFGIRANSTFGLLNEIMSGFMQLVLLFTTKFQKFKLLGTYFRTWLFPLSLCASIFHVDERLTVPFNLPAHILCTILARRIFAP